ncbi:hypothetical protein NSQ20_05175 [Paenibacillus sp. FSL K6-1122]|uniref:hypothetical protein n=1 Tax=Paenibacillus TaxID=44249 RepID=UPI0006497191|nr:MULTISPECIES: hypothetical protein [Paenibacillus]KLU52969.1 hypothetical protein EL84_11320 [Paenibacillus sp. VT-400]MCP1424891.1 hypothetical protein [Paenibacillus xylanexedens]OMF02457.1 hypothetical protein BK129_24665 [Paenibacillus amylolyticus]OMF41205.1 hypothetical protein BK136_21775 [Paenibacillus amylolyticus]PJN64926.1 hypothetical protein PAEAM_05200 [Paenibacillus sp. GM1FR]
MDYEIFLQSKLDRNSLGKLIEQYVTESVVEKASFQSNAEEIVIGSRFFTLHLEIEDISDITFVRQHYNLDVNVCIRTQLFGSTFSEGIEHIFSIISKLIKHTEGNLLFLEDGSTQLLRMENGLLVVNNRLDEYQTKYLTPSLLLLLDRPYIEKELSS